MRKEFEIVNKLGLHARPAAEFVRCVVRFKSTITICKGEENFSAASILGALTANLNYGDRVVLERSDPMSKRHLVSLKRCCCVFGMKKVRAKNARNTNLMTNRPWTPNRTS
jgi:phosphocarrier protein